MSKQAIEFGMQMAIMDAIENGATEKAAVIEYMGSDVCKAAAERYAALFSKAFA